MHESQGKIEVWCIHEPKHIQCHGSLLKSNHYFTLEVTNKDGLVVRLNMTSYQFALLQSSVGDKAGVQCTIEQIGTRELERPPIEKTKSIIHDKIKADIYDLNTMIDDIDATGVTPLQELKDRFNKFGAKADIIIDQAIQQILEETNIHIQHLSQKLKQDGSDTKTS